MNLAKLVFVLLAAVAVAFSQPVDIDTTTPEGQLLQQIGTEEDMQKKVGLLEQFAQQYPNHDAVKWVLAQLPPAYVELQQPDKSLAACETLLGKDPANAAAAHGCLKTAEAKQDPVLLKKWALATHAAADKATSAPKPEFEYVEDEEEWKQSVAFATDVGRYSEWALYNGALQAQDPAQKLELIAALKEANPESEHLASLTVQEFIAYRQAGQVDQAVALAEELTAEGKADEDMMLVAADYFFNQKKDMDKAMEYCTKLVEYLEPKEAPEGIDAATWDAKKKNSLGLAYWMMGVNYSTKQQFADADKTLRKALPNIQGNAQMLAGALFHLGLANYQMGAKSGNEKQILAAHKYTKQCAAMASPFQGQAKKNLAAIESQYRLQ
jgi:hypothetical protein